MEINNKSKRSIYLYDPLVEIEKGDWVVKGDRLYICLADCVGKDPDTERDYYKLYLSENTGTLEDLIAYSKDVLAEDKFVNAYSLGEIFNAYMIGYNERGIITSEVGDNGEIFVSDYFGDEISINPNPSYTDPLDKIMTAPELNNAIFSVSRDVVASILGTTSGATGNVILRQYTYKDEDSIYIRVQELIDETTGFVRYRYSLSSNSFEPSGAWTSTTVNSSFKTTVDNVINYYNSKLIEMEREKAANKATFRFRNIKLPSSYQPSSISSATNTLTISKTDLGYKSGMGDMFITITTAYLEQSSAAGVIGGNDNVFRTDSVTINLGDFLGSIRETESYNIVGTKLLVIKKSGNNVEFLTNEGSKITNIYARQSFGDYASLDNARVLYELTTTNQPVDTRLGGVYKYIFPRTSCTIKGSTKKIDLTDSGYITVSVTPSLYRGGLWNNDTSGTREFTVQIGKIAGLDTANYFYAHDPNNKVRIAIEKNDTSVTVYTYLFNENGNRDLGIIPGVEPANPLYVQDIKVMYSL